jgi:uncharacterized membrane protein
MAIGTRSRGVRATAGDWVVPAGLIALGLIPAIAGSVRLVDVASAADVTADNARFLASPLPVVLHVLAAIPYGLLGPLQFSPAFRRRFRGWHRAVGKLLVPAGLVVALSGLWMAHFYELPAFDGPIVYVERLVFGTAMLIAMLRGIAAIGGRDFVSHGEWMTRAYAIGMGAGTQASEARARLAAGGVPRVVTATAGSSSQTSRSQEKSS